MATVVFLRSTKTAPSVLRVTTSNYLDALSVGVGQVTIDTSSTTPAAPAERPFLLSAIPVRWYSERVASQLTISGAITCAIGGQAITGFTGRLRVRLAKITAGGSAVETPIGSADAAADLVGTVATYTFTLTPGAAVTVAPNERFVIDVVTFPPSGTYTSGSGRLYFNASSSFGKSTLTFTETFTFIPNETNFILRRTNTIGIGNFLDLSETLGSTTKTTAVVNTSAAATEIQWTRTAGGTLLEFISPRFKAPGWTPDDPAYFKTAAAGTIGIYAFESNLSANCGIRGKWFRRQINGTEDEAAVVSTTGELSTTAARQVFPTPTITNVLNFEEDHRLVFRLYIIPVGGTMGGGFTCTLDYDHNATNIDGYSSFWIAETPGFKAEGDPAGTSRVEGGLTTLGIGN